jgi:sugar/nucleoside kinase (ribokinase family)
VSAQLVDSGVDARLALDPVRSTGRCVVLVTPDGERTMAPDSGANERLADGDLPDDLLRPGAHLHVAGYALLRAGSGPAARSAIARAVRRRMTVSVDPASAALLSPSFLDDAAGAGLLLPNAEEAEVLTRERDPERAARLLAARFAEVVVTLGPEGALWTNGREILRVDAVPVELGVDSIGAGDAFTAGLLAARLTGAGPAEAMVMGTRLAASAVATPGGRP